MDWPAGRSGGVFQREGLKTVTEKCRSAVAASPVACSPNIPKLPGTKHERFLVTYSYYSVLAHTLSNPCVKDLHTRPIPPWYSNQVQYWQPSTRTKQMLSSLCGRDTSTVSLRIPHMM
jgi:hypothetical protein